MVPYFVTSLLSPAGVQFAAFAKTLTFSFAVQPPGNETGFALFTEAEKSTVRSVLSKYSAVSGLQFVESNDSIAVDIRYVKDDLTSLGLGNAAGYATVSRPGQVHFKSGQWEARNNFLVFHETGHVLGLKHPFENPTLPEAENIGTNTVMGYNGQTFPSPELGYFDVAAIQYLYGVNPMARAGNDTHTVSSTSSNFIWDGAGTDTLSASSVAEDVTLYLEPGYWGYVDSKASTITAAGQVTVNFGSTIENLIGGSGNDELFGNASNNVIAGGAGNDRIDGGAGIDTSAYSGNRANYVLTLTSTGWSVRSKTDGDDTLANSERTKFADTTVALDLSPTEHGGQALEFIGLMAPALVNTPSVVGLILGLFDQGKSLHDVCQLALDVGLVNSIAGSGSNAALAAMAFRNLIGSNADAATVDMLVGFMDGRSASYSQAEFMTVVAGMEVNQTHIGLVGLQQTGIEYV